MHFLLRTLLHGLRSRLRSRVDLWDVTSTAFRVLPTDLDVLRHMNNGVYLSLLDIARFDMLLRSRTWEKMKARGWYPVVVSETISFRKSLELWQRFEVESRMLGIDERALYMEQRFVVEGEVYARAFIKARILSRVGGMAPMDELREMAGEPGVEGAGGAGSEGAGGAGSRIPEWVAQWGRDAALPSTRAPAPSEWE
jgi:acyl-CoA thioesterase FadM